MHINIKLIIYDLSLDKLCLIGLYILAFINFAMMFCRDIKHVSFAIQFRRKIKNEISTSAFDLDSKPFQPFNTRNPDFFIQCFLPSAKYSIFTNENRVCKSKCVELFLRED